MIDISNLDKAAVLAALFNASKQQGMGFLSLDGAKPMTVADAQAEISQGLKRFDALAKEHDKPEGYYSKHAYDFDYLRGRVMKVDISGSEMGEWLFDRDNGSGAAARAIDAIRQPITA